MRDQMPRPTDRGWRDGDERVRRCRGPEGKSVCRLSIRVSDGMLRDGITERRRQSAELESRAKLVLDKLLDLDQPVVTDNTDVVCQTRKQQASILVTRAATHQ